ncbi:calcium-dependent protein kinase 3 [Plasmodium gonderi]|uniref:Calcium-dependent protein kinase 3 n=1 Tax=Plasmodium gonderi TaxID=77519 RepID=A0A1Y1JLS6_PLAGO|nr:calcium-dependent protein kinase 3 [Plasmodium gonderi]GAW83439.1 calcium-dependent protein kinase 3 [Plasmodium gonderi]
MPLKKTPFSLISDIISNIKNGNKNNEWTSMSRQTSYDSIKELYISDLGYFKIVKVLLRGLSSTVCLCEWVIDSRKTLVLKNYVNYINNDILGCNIKINESNDTYSEYSILDADETTSIRSSIERRFGDTNRYRQVSEGNQKEKQQNGEEPLRHGESENRDKREEEMEAEEIEEEEKDERKIEEGEMDEDEKEKTFTFAYINRQRKNECIIDAKKRQNQNNNYCYSVAHEESENKILHIVLKVKHKELYYKVSEIEELRREIGIHKNLKHCNILQMILSAEDENDIWVFLEYSSVGDLYTYVGFNILGEIEVKIIVCQILFALYYLHIKGIIHCDIKPQNLLLFHLEESFPFNSDMLPDLKLPHGSKCKKLNITKLISSINENVANHPNDNTFKNIVKIGDFGLSVRCAFDEFYPYRGIRGSYGFIAPELFQESDFNNKIDMWALGIIIYILLGGYKPFYPCSRFEEKVTFHERYWFNISSEAKNFIQSLLQINPSKRLNVIEAIDHPWISSYFIST